VGQIGLPLADLNLLLLFEQPILQLVEVVSEIGGGASCSFVSEERHLACQLEEVCLTALSAFMLARTNRVVPCIASREKSGVCVLTSFIPAS
jgi:hypothetical protein